MVGAHRVWAKAFRIQVISGCIVVLSLHPHRMRRVIVVVVIIVAVVIVVAAVGIGTVRGSFVEEDDDRRM